MKAACLVVFVARRFRHPVVQGFSGEYSLAVFRHAAVTVRRLWWSWIARRAGGEADERSRAAVGAGRGRSAPPEPGGGPRPAVHHERGVLPGRGQGAGQIRNAARASGRPATGHRGGGGARLLPGGVLFGVSLVRAARDGRAARRTARAPRAGQVDAGDREFICSAAPGSGAQVAEQVADRFGVRLHRRTVERVRGK